MAPEAACSLINLTVILLRGYVALLVVKEEEKRNNKGDISP